MTIPGDASSANSDTDAKDPKLALKTDLVDLVASYNLTLAHLRDHVPQVLDENSFSAASSLDIFFTDTDFRIIEVILSDVLAAFDTDELRCRTSTDGSTFDSGANEYEFALIGRKSDGTDISTAGTSETSIRIAASLGSASAESLSAVIRILDPSTAKTKHIDINAKLQDSDGIWRTYVGGGMRDTEANVNGIQFFMPGGNMSGRYQVIGYPQA